LDKVKQLISKDTKSRDRVQAASSVRKISDI